MKVYIGPYKSQIGPYQIADLFQKIKISEETCDKIGDYLNKTWIKTFCEWIHDKRKIKRKIRIDEYDTWSMSNTLAHIVHPMLVQLKQVKHGAPYTDDDDVPEGISLRASEAPAIKNQWETDENFFKRWDWIMNEII